MTPPTPDFWLARNERMDPYKPYTHYNIFHFLLHYFIPSQAKVRLLEGHPCWGKTFGLLIFGNPRTRIVLP